MDAPACAVADMNAGWLMNESKIQKGIKASSYHK